MNSDSAPENLVAFNQLQCLSLKKKILEIEGRVVSLEADILAHANQLNDVISEELSLVTATNVVEFNQNESISESSLNERTEWLSYGDTSDDVFQVLENARDKLDILNEHIDCLELPS